MSNVAVESYKTWAGELIVDITTGQANAARTIRLRDEDARALLADLKLLLETEDEQAETTRG